MWYVEDEMETRKIIVIAIVVVVIVAGGFILYWQREAILNSTKIGGQEQAQDQAQPIAIQDQTITDNTNPFNISIRYPYTEGLDSFNQKVKNIIDTNIGEFKTISLQNDEAVKKVDPEGYASYPRQYDLNIGYTKGQTDENVISIVFEIYTFTGGAHGATNFLAFNYNPKTNSQIQLADLFDGQADYIQKISDFCIPELEKQVTERLGSTEGTWVQDGASASADNFSVFMRKKDSIIFFFQQYQIAPYVAGDFQVVMPR